MAIQWFPGHMHLTRKAIAERIKDIDVVIELLDARLPGSSANPLLNDLTRGTPALKVLNKQDLADPALTAAWVDHYNAQPSTRAVPLDASASAPAQQLIKACRTLAPNRVGLAKPMRVLICGIPNVGKSTLINTLAGKRAALTGDEAGITKLEQRLALASDFYLFDTPGLLWPRIVAPQSGFHLAASGAIGRNAYDEEEVALQLLAVLQRRYPARLEARFKLNDAKDTASEAVLTEIGRQRGALLAGGRINLQKAAEIVLNEFRNASLGPITLETPAEVGQWIAAGTAIESEKRAAKVKKKRKAGDATP